LKDVHRVKLRNGTTIKATGDHRFLTEHGWRELCRLSIGDFLATPQKLSTIREGRVLTDTERARTRVLAYLLGDGSLSTAQISFYSSDASLLNEFENACRSGFDGLDFSRRQQARDVTRLSVSRNREYAGAYHVPSTLEGWLRDDGLRWKKSDARADGTNRKGPRSSENGFSSFTRKKSLASSQPSGIATDTLATALSSSRRSRLSWPRASRRSCCVSESARRSTSRPTRRLRTDNSWSGPRCR
jgi:hypothetical protein